MADRGDEKRGNPVDDMVRGEADEQIRGIASDDDDEFEDTEDLDDEEEDENENEEGSF